MPLKTFKHSGDMGDVIFSLPTMRALGGGILYLDPEGGLAEPLVRWPHHERTKLDRAAIDSLTPLLLRQPYIAGVRYWKGEAVDYNLDRFRQHVRYNNLSDSSLAAFGLSPSERDLAWLTVDAVTVADPARTIVISRSVRYHGNHVFWENILPEIKDRCLFVGLGREHEIFVYTFGIEVPFFPTGDILALARVIGGATQFIGNQGLPHAIAEGMKKTLVNEVFRVYPAAIFRRPGAQYV